jgi:hypothetical protein
LNGVQGVAGSNPAVPTILLRRNRSIIKDELLRSSTGK